MKLIKNVAFLLNAAWQACDSIDYPICFSLTKNNIFIWYRQKQKKKTYKGVWYLAMDFFGAEEQKKMWIVR